MEKDEVMEENEKIEELAIGKKMSTSELIRKIFVSLLIFVVVGGIFTVIMLVSKDQIYSKNLADAFEKTGFNYSIVNEENASYIDDYEKGFEELIKEAKSEHVNIWIKNCGAFEYSNSDDKNYCYGYYFHFARRCDEVFSAYEKLQRNIDGNNTGYGYKFVLIKKGSILFLVNYSADFEDENLPEPLEKLIKKVYGKKRIAFYEAKYQTVE